MSYSCLIYALLYVEDKDKVKDKTKTKGGDMATLIELLKALSDKEAPISTADLAKAFGASREGTHRWVNLPPSPSLFCWPQLSASPLDSKPSVIRGA